MKLREFTILPILGLNTAVSADDLSLFRFVSDSMAMTHDTGGVNVDYNRKRNSCTKSFGYKRWSNSANGQATKCLGLFELYDGTNRNYIYFDYGKVYNFDSSLDPTEITVATPVTFAQDDVDLYSIIRVGSYVVWADRGEHTPYKWSHGDANSTKLIQSGTEYKFRYLEPFQRRVIGAYSDQTDGDIEIRWSTDWPSTAITSMNFPAANQLYIPNDDQIMGIKTMGRDRCFVYSENSIHSLEYTSNYSIPFALRNVISNQGITGHHSIVSLGDKHYCFNKFYGFTEFNGSKFPSGGRPISWPIEKDLQDLNTEYMNLIVGCYVPLTREICWSVPLTGNSKPSHLLFYNIDTFQWRKEDKQMSYVNHWRVFNNYTWNDFIAELGGAGAVWNDITANATWAYYTHHKNRLVMGYEDGYLYYHINEDLQGSHIDGYRIEPILSFGDPYRKDKLSEIWIGIGSTGSFSIDFYHRSGETTGQLLDQSWTSVGSISCDSPDPPVLKIDKMARLHQIKWGTDLKDEKFEVNKITFRYMPGQEKY